MRILLNNAMCPNTEQYQRSGISHSFYLSLQKSNVLVDSRAAQVADPRQFGHIQLPLLVGVVVPKEGSQPSPEY